MSSDSSESENGGKRGKKRRLTPISSASNTRATESEDLILEKALSIMEKKDDEFDIFGQFIASEMRQLTNPSTRFVLKTEIMKIIQQHVYSSVIDTTHTQNQHQNYPQQNQNIYSQPFAHNSIYSAPTPNTSDTDQIAIHQYSDVQTNASQYNNNNQIIHTTSGLQSSANVGTNVYTAYSAVQNDDCLYIQL